MKVVNTIEPLKRTVETLSENLVELDNKTLSELLALMRKQVEAASTITDRYEDLSRKVQPSAILESQIRAKYQQATRVKKAQTKGKALEELVALLFASIDGFKEVDRNINTATEEIDVVFRNESRDAFWQRESQLILFECKNWHSQRVGKNEFVLFKEKMKNRGRHCRLGFLICTDVFADTIKKEMLRESQSDILVVPIDGDDLRKLIESIDRSELMKKYVEQATMI